jgi:glycerol-3-phosphate acyltransferase PlsY
MLDFGILLVASYLVGSIPLAYLIVRWRFKADIRQYGSGQVGGSNTYRSFSKRLGIGVALFDFGKGILMVWIARLLGLEATLQLAVGIAAVIGHNWPVFLRFNGGRGIATGIGVSLFVVPMAVPAVLFFALFTLFLGSSPLPLLLGVAVLPLSSWGLGEPLGVTLGLAVFFFIIVLRRLIAPKTERSAQVGTRELLLNRLFFDRDIKDGQAWIHSKPVVHSGDKPAGREKE